MEKIIRICCICLKALQSYEIKESDKVLLSHGYCKACEMDEMKKIDMVAKEIENSIRRV